MKNLGAFCAVLPLLAFFTQTSARGEASITEVVKKVKPAVVTVIAYDDKGKEAGQGSGFFIDPSHVITNWHVIKDAAKAKVKTWDGKMFIVKGVSACNTLADVASVVLTAPVREASVLAVGRGLPKEGEKIVVVGSPLGLEASVSDGIVSAVRDLPGLGKIIQITAPISPGSSGSPVVNLNAEVVGVATRQITEGQSLNFAAASEHILSLKSHGLTALGPSKGTVRHRAEEQALQGLRLFFQRKHSKALPHFDTATKIDPTYVDGWGMLGVCHQSLGRTTEAPNACKEAIRMCPDDADAHFNLAEMYHTLDRYAEAVEEYKEAIRIEPDHAQAHSGLGTTYVLLQDKRAALDEYRILKHLDAEYAKILFDFIYE